MKEYQPKEVLKYFSFLAPIAHQLFLPKAYLCRKNLFPD